MQKDQHKQNLNVVVQYCENFQDCRVRLGLRSGWERIESCCLVANVMLMAAGAAAAVLQREVRRRELQQHVRRVQGESFFASAPPLTSGRCGVPGAGRHRRRDLPYQLRQGGALCVCAVWGEGGWGGGVRWCEDLKTVSHPRTFPTTERRLCLSMLQRAPTPARSGSSSCSRTPSLATSRSTPRTTLSASVHLLFVSLPFPDLILLPLPL